MAYTDTNDSTKNQTCTYSADDLTRIASVNCGSSTWEQNFIYDPLGNITKSGSLTYAAGYNPATNQVNSGITPLPSYDANGNQKSSTGLSSISWDAYAQPISVTPQSGGAISGWYDALGRLVENDSGTSHTQFVFSPAGQKIAVVQASILAKGFIPLPGGATAIYSGTSGMPYIRHIDWLGSARLATTWSHAVQSKIAYAPFGETYNEAGTSSGDRSFTGQDQGTVTSSGGMGIYDFMFRKYDPSAGRWLSPDPAGWGAVNQAAPQSLDRYAYVMNNPLSLVDQYGWDGCNEDDETDETGISIGDCDTQNYTDDQTTYAYTPGTIYLDTTTGQYYIADSDGNLEPFFIVPAIPPQMGCDPSADYQCGMLYTQSQPEGYIPNSAPNNFVSAIQLPSLPWSHQIKKEFCVATYETCKLDVELEMEECKIMSHLPSSPVGPVSPLVCGKIMKDVLLRACSIQFEQCMDGDKILPN
jgi:RHS repeat-associated protein